jgi:hypothetical protein
MANQWYPTNNLGCLLFSWQTFAHLSPVGLPTGKTPVQFGTRNLWLTPWDLIGGRATQLRNLRWFSGWRKVRKVKKRPGNAHCPPSRPASPPGNSSRRSSDLSEWWNSPERMLFFLVGGFNHLEKYESQWEGLSHILWKIKNVWNHQPVLALVHNPVTVVKPKVPDAAR